MAAKSAAQAVRKPTASEKKALAARPLKATASAQAAPPPERESNCLPVEQFPDLLDVLPALAERSRELAAEIKERETERKALSDQIGSLLVAAGHDSIKGETWAVTRSVSVRSMLKKELLLAHGVTMDTIIECTESKQFYTITVRGVKDGGE